MNQSSLIVEPHWVRRRAKPCRRDFLLLGLAAAGVTACTSPKVKDNRIRHAMGQRVAIGPLAYNVLEAKWEASLGEAPLPRMPERRFLLLRLSVTNGGGSPITFPTLSLLTEQGEKFEEQRDLKGVTDPLGMVRLLGVTETVFGWILYDVPQNDYLLELTDGIIENEQTALVELPLRLT